MISLPDHILLKPGKLSGHEHTLMQAHATLGADALQGVIHKYGSAITFLGMAIDIVRHHHERFDGIGYPDGLAGSSIPLAARITSIADVYDAIRSFRTCKPPLPHATAVRVLTEESEGQFDPILIAAFREVSGKFQAIFEEIS
jgi:putative two-component system response regulator